MTITKLLYHPVTVLSLTIVAIMFFFSLDKSSKKTQISSENIRVLEYEVNQISQEVIQLEEKIEDSESLQFKEKVVRNELLLQKPGEYILQISNQITENISDQENKNLIQNESNIKKWQNLIF